MTRSPSSLKAWWVMGSNISQDIRTIAEKHLVRINEADTTWSDMMNLVPVYDDYKVMAEEYRESLDNCTVGLQSLEFYEDMAKLVLNVPDSI